MDRKDKEGVLSDLSVDLVNKNLLGCFFLFLFLSARVSFDNLILLLHFFLGGGGVAA